MAIYDILKEQKDRRESDTGTCDFNGYLEDYIGVLEDDETKQTILGIFQSILEEDENLRIVVNLQLSINKDAIANQIIRYKDSFKLPHGEIKCPYLIYGKNDELQRGFILCYGEQEAYIMAKSLYYLMSEPDNEFEGTRNEIISMHMNEDNISMVKETVHRFFLNHEKAGLIQRSLDRLIFKGYDDMYVLAKSMGEVQLQNINETLTNSLDKEKAINFMIAKWFLLKKFSYVQYMMDKNTLNRIHEGNVKKQRQMAKENSDAIGFVSYAELWKMAKTLESGTH